VGTQNCLPVYKALMRGHDIVVDIAKIVERDAAAQFQGSDVSTHLHGNYSGFLQTYDLGQADLN